MLHLVTGGAGFIGSHIAHRLLDDGHAVRIVDNLDSGNLANLEDIRGEVEFLQGDIRDREFMHRAVTGVDTIFHQAADPSVPRSIADPARTFDMNVDGALSVLTAARSAGCRRLVFASTCAVYGDSLTDRARESQLPMPLSPYAISKLTGEHLCKMFTRLYNLEAVSLRYFNVYGPRQDPSSAYAAVIPKFLDALLNGQRPMIFGDGEQSRDFVAIADVVRANLLAATVPDVGGCVFNVAGGQSTTINQVLETLIEATGIDIAADYRPARPGDIRHSLADTSFARERLGFSAAVSFRDGVESIVSETLSTRNA